MVSGVGRQQPTVPPGVSRGGYRLALLLAALTFPLIWVGGLVTTYDAGMAVPDWPGTYGYNLFLYPWQTWLSGPWDLFIEHGHRLLGALVGLVALILCGWVWLYDCRWHVRWFSVAVLVGVVSQGVIGGLRVWQDDPRIAQLHGCTGPVFFVLTVVMAWLARPIRAEVPAACRVPRVLVTAWGVTCLAAFQLALGSVLRHVTFATGLSTFRAAVIMHVIGGVGLTVYAWYQVSMTGRQWRVVRERRDWHVAGIALLVTLQFTLGLASWALRYGVPQWLAGDVAWVNVAGSMHQSLVITTHVALGALILALSALWGMRVTGTSWCGWGFLGLHLPWTSEVFQVEVIG